MFLLEAVSVVRWDRVTQHSIWLVALKTYSLGDCTTFLSNLLCCWAVLSWQFFLISFQKPDVKSLWFQKEKESISWFLPPSFSFVTFPLFSFYFNLLSWRHWCDVPTNSEFPTSTTLFNSVKLMTKVTKKGNWGKECFNGLIMCKPIMLLWHSKPATNGKQGNAPWLFCSFPFLFKGKIMWVKSVFERLCYQNQSSSTLLKTDREKCGKHIRWHGDLPSVRAVSNATVTTKTEAG